MTPDESVLMEPMTAPMTPRTVDDAGVLLQGVIVGESIGSGSFGDVFSGLFTGTKVALKVVPNADSQAVDGTQANAAYREFINECEILSRLRHPNVVQMFGLAIGGDGASVAAPKNPGDSPPQPLSRTTTLSRSSTLNIETCNEAAVAVAERATFLVMEYMAKGSAVSLLQQLMLKGRPLSASIKLQIARDAARGVEFLHSKGVIHRDLSCRNLLVDSNFRAKVADFGLAREGHDTYYSTSAKAAVPVRWASPEQLLQGKTSSKSDVYSFSTTVWEIFSDGMLPFTSLSNQEVSPIVLSGKTAEHLATPDSAAETELSFEDCVWPGWLVDPDARPTMAQVREWIEDACEESVQPGSFLQPVQSEPVAGGEAVYGFSPATLESSEAISVRGTLSDGDGETGEMEESSQTRSPDPTYDRGFLENRDTPLSADGPTNYSEMPSRGDD
jgi:serine/threonine protein kinase